MKRVLLAAFFGLFFLVNANAQKFGHIFSQDLLDSLPAYKSAESKIQKFIDEATKELEQMQKTIENQARDLEMGKDTMDQFIYERKMRDLQMQYQRFQEKQQQSEQDLQIYQAREMKPIIDNLQKAIQTVGDREKFTYIFEASETSPGVPVYVDGGTDITDMVRKELNSYYK
ncbi:MAG: OmpH family outer membrane protein [Crocinitomicaceae bacterium]|nr:OmpH family outer membrane protein [Crocinitomicaceae bacterium]